MFFKSRESQVHAHICQELEARMARTGAPREIRAFLLERWSYLLAGIYVSRGDDNADWEAGWHTVNALLWSLTPKRDPAEVEQFMRLLPTLLGRLEDGCTAMGLSPGERDELFAQLAMLHAAVSRPGLEAVHDAGGSAVRHDVELAFSDSELAALDAGTAPAAPAPAEAPRTEASIEDLRIGDRLSLVQDGKEKVLSLQWVSPMGGMFMFAGKDGFDAVSLTRARLADKLARGEASLSKGEAAQG